MALEADKQWYVGPDNGLFDIVCRRSSSVHCRRIDWQPETLSASFHGRDLYAPAVAMLRNNQDIGPTIPWNDRHGWPDDLEELVYIDHFGNCMTGLRTETLANNRTIRANSITVPHAHTFSSVPRGSAFWYGNSQGLVEIAVNGGNAAQQLNLRIGSKLIC